MTSINTSSRPASPTNREEKKADGGEPSKDNEKTKDTFEKKPRKTFGKMSSKSGLKDKSSTYIREQGKSGMDNLENSQKQPPKAEKSFFKQTLEALKEIKEVTDTVSSMIPEGVRTNAGHLVQAGAAGFGSYVTQPKPQTAEETASEQKDDSGESKPKETQKAAQGGWLHQAFNHMGEEALDKMRRATEDKKKKDSSEQDKKS